jgi:predicted RNA binding protein YcfA (HicA-like mRNA interferase family)
MPPKIRDLKKQLRKAGFTNSPDRGKGSHSLWIDPNDPGNRVNLAGHDGSDAKPYQVRETEQAIQRRDPSG